VGNYHTDPVALTQKHRSVELVPGPFVGAGEFGDVPAPDLVGAGGDEFGFDECRSAGLGSSFTYLVTFTQETIHRRHGCQVGVFVEQGGPYLGGALSQKRSSLSVATTVSASAGVSAFAERRGSGGP
jgi:hypothetical protein